MTLIQAYLDKWKEYQPEGICPSDFRAFWLDNLGKDRPAKAHLSLEAIDYPLSQVEVFRASIQAGDGATLKGLYLRPAQKTAEGRGFPGLVRFHGYSGNRGEIPVLLFWALQGYAILALDIRGQCGDTPDPRSYQRGRYTGWLTQGLDSPHNYYYRQVYLDALRAVSALSSQPEVDEERIGVFGKSQGGGLAVIAAGLMNSLGREVGLQTHVKAVASAIPFLTDLRGSFASNRGTTLTELDWYFRLTDPEHKSEASIFKVLDYYDARFFAPWLGENTRSIMALGLKDNDCPAHTIHALYRSLSGQKELLIYPDYGHEVPDAYVDRQVRFFAETL